MLGGLFKEFGGDIISSGFSAFNASANRADAQRAQNQSEAFNERMSNTTYQRMIEDLGKAGLSPMLAYSKTGSAPTSSGVTGTSSVEAPKFGETSLRQSQAALAKEQLEVAKSQAQLNTNTAFKAAAEANLADKNAAKVEVETNNLGQPFLGLNEAQIKELGSRFNLQTSSAGKVQTEEKILKPQADFATENPVVAKYIDPVTKIMHTILQGLGLMRGSAAMPFVTQNAPRGK
jgi:hypothetical protein